ncbi:MAG: hypothetical protein GY874_23425 [Desulfobacteraceae bacterium]|nr:hypothetical protein [Desulfobacteraceae bacterium]
MDYFGDKQAIARIYSIQLLSNAKSGKEKELIETIQSLSKQVNSDSENNENTLKGRVDDLIFGYISSIDPFDIKNNV